MNMHSSSLSPIISNDSQSSAASSTIADYASGQEEEVELASEERRRLIMARSQCRTPSTGSQVSELADETAAMIAETNGIIGGGGGGGGEPQVKGFIATSKHVCDSRQRLNLQGGSNGKATKRSHAASFASQYLFHTNHPHLYPSNMISSSSSTSSNNVNQSNSNNNKRKLRQFIQSIPLPLVATSIITVFILCLLLSECKSLQVLPKKAVRSLLVSSSSEPEIASSQAQMLTSSSNAGEGANGDTVDIFKQVMPTELGDRSATPEQLGSQLLKLEDQLALKRDLINDLIHQRRFRNTLMSQQVSSSSNPSAGEQQASDSSSNSNKQRRTVAAQTSGPTEAEQVAALEPSQSAVDSLGAMLFGQGGPEVVVPSEEQADVVYIDGEPNSSGSAHRTRSPTSSGSGSGSGSVGAGEQVSIGRPAHLRSSQLELDLSDEQQAGAPGQRYKQQQQPHHHQTSNSNNPNLEQNQIHLSQHHNNYNHQPPAHNLRQTSVDQMRTQHQYQQQQQQQQQQLTGNNHDRLFDVAQIQCNNTEDGFERFACPSPDRQGRYRCIEDRLFCDGYYDCPNGEDEGRVACMYYKLSTKTKPDGRG